MITGGITLLDGAMGTELRARGVRVRDLKWRAAARNLEFHRAE